jgi:hypothetical protein
MQHFIHYFLHFVFPVIVAYVVFRKEWKRAALIFLLTMLVDLDHILATPIFQANRCSIGYHPLHSYFAIGIYSLALFLPKPFRFIALGLLMHMATDYLDCLLMRNWDS